MKLFMMNFCPSSKFIPSCRSMLSSQVCLTYIKNNIDTVFAVFKIIFFCREGTGGRKMSK